MYWGITMETMTRKKLAGMMDHTFLKAYATDKDFEKLCGEAKEHGFAMVAINSSPVKLCKALLKDTDVHVGAAISFPLGQTTIETKVFETKKAIEDGADEIDYVINIGELKMGNYDYIKKEMEAIVAVCRENNVLSKVIFENCYLEKEEIVRVAQIAKEVKPDFIKTSTGFSTNGATVISPSTFTCCSFEISFISGITSSTFTPCLEISCATLTSINIFVMTSFFADCFSISCANFKLSTE